MCLQVRSGTGAALPEPTEDELEELYRAVDFHPEEEQQAAAAAAAAADAAGAPAGASAGASRGSAASPASGLHLSLRCLVAATSLLLRDAPVVAAAATQPEGAAAGGSIEEELEGQKQQQGYVDSGSSRAGAGQVVSASICDSGGSSSIAIMELDQLRFALHVQPGDTSASASLEGAAVRDLCSEGPGVSAELLVRFPGGAGAAPVAAGSPTSSAAASFAADGSVGDAGSTGVVDAPPSLPPLLRLHFSAVAAAAATEAWSPTQQQQQQQELRPQLDVLVQPLLLRMRPLCVQRLVALVPPVLLDSFHGRQLAALNALGPEERCAVKAREVQQLGPPLDLLVKVRAVGGVSRCLLMHTCTQRDLLAHTAWNHST